MPSHHDYGIDCETYCGGTPDDEPQKRDCMNCGTCEDCIARSIAVAEDAEFEEVGKEIDVAITHCGHLINMNNGRCARAEEMLIQIQDVLLKLSRPRGRCSVSFPHPPHDFCDGNPKPKPGGGDQ